MAQKWCGTFVCTQSAGTVSERHASDTVIRVLPFRLLAIRPISRRDGDRSPRSTSVLFRTQPPSLDLVDSNRSERGSLGHDLFSDSWEEACGHAFPIQRTREGCRAGRVCRSVSVIPGPSVRPDLVWPRA